MRGKWSKVTRSFDPEKGGRSASVKAMSGKGIGVLVMLLALGLALAVTPKSRSSPLLLAQQQPVLQVSPTSLSFEGQVGGPAPDPQALTIVNAGGGLMEWHASANAGWIILGGTEGKLSGGRAIQLQVFVNIDGLGASTYQSTITIEAPSAQGSPVQVTVTLTLEPPPKQPAFFKVVDLSVEPSSPVAGSTVTIKATLENTGEEVGTKPVELYIDGVRQDSRSLTLNPGQREMVSFSYTFAFTEPPREIAITVKTPDEERTLYYNDLSGTDPAGQPY
jgi:hypothetical protein